MSVRTNTKERRSGLKDMFFPLTELNWLHWSRIQVHTEEFHHLLPSGLRANQNRPQAFAMETKIQPSINGEIQCKLLATLFEPMEGRKQAV